MGGFNQNKMRDILQVLVMRQQMILVVGGGGARGVDNGYVNIGVPLWMSQVFELGIEIHLFP